MELAMNKKYEVFDTVLGFLISLLVATALIIAVQALFIPSETATIEPATSQIQQGMSNYVD